MMRRAFIGLILFLWSFAVSAATLLPPGKQQFLGPDGAPLAAGQVFFYVPGTTTSKDTYKDSSAATLNTNPVVLDASGFAVIYGTGSYREIVKDASGTVIYDQLTADTSSGNSSWAGTAGGSANALSVTASAFSAQDGQTVSWRNAATNTGAATVTIAGSIYAIVKDTLAGPMPLIGSEMRANDISTVTFDSVLGQMHLVVPLSVSPYASVASTATTDLGAVGSSNVHITGTATITSLGSSASTSAPYYNLTFASTASLTYNATSLITPTTRNLFLKANASATAKYLGSGNWQILSVTIPSSLPTRTTLTTGSGTYTVPNGVVYIAVRMLGGGGGGGGIGAAATNGGTGGTSTFGTFTTVGGSGGVGVVSGSAPGTGGIGGTGGTGTANLRIHGQAGALGVGAFAGGVVAAGGVGGSSPLGGAGSPDLTGTTANINAATNSGSGGAGASPTSVGGAGGGGASEYAEILIPSPAATYSYIVGAAGIAGTGGAGSGGSGGAGIIIVEELYQ